MSWWQCSRRGAKWGLVTLCCTMTKYPAQTSGLDNSFSNLVQKCVAVAAVFWGAVKSPGDSPGVVSAEFGEAIWLPYSWASWSCNSSFFISRSWVSFWSWRAASLGVYYITGDERGKKTPLRVVSSETTFILHWRNVKWFPCLHSLM